MTSHKKEIATYVAGAMAWHALTHLALAVTSSEEPHRSLGIKMTPARHTAAAALAAGMSLFLMRFRWA